MKFNKKQQGFAMLEVVLAIVIIAIASFGVYTLYNSSSTSSKINSEEDVVSQIYNQATQMAAVNLKQPSESELVNSGAFASDMYTTTEDSKSGVSTTTFTGSFGEITYSSDDDGTYSVITAKTVPGTAANQLAAHMMDWGVVKIDGVAYDSSTTTFDPDEFYNIELYFPAANAP